MAIDRRVLAMVAMQRGLLAEVTDRQARALLVAWARAWDEIAVEIARVAESQAVHDRITLRQAERSLRRASQQLGQLIAQSGVVATSDLLRIVRLGSEHAEDLTAAQLPARVRVLTTDPRQLDAIVKRSTQAITARHYDLAQDAQDALRRELVRTIAVGDNPRTAARNMVARSQELFNGGRNRALTIARTEQLDAYRSAGHANNQANSDVLDSWEWIADLSPRTCRSCLAQHGSRHPVDEPGPLDHQQGRCARVPVTKSWAELGFPELDEPASDVPSAEDWLNRQPEDVQRKILTNRGYDQWKAGDYPPSDWSHRRSTSGWRDSMAPSTPPRSPADGS